MRGLKLLNLSNFSINGILASIILLLSLFTMYNFDDVNAAEKNVTVNSVGFEKTAIVEFTNYGTIDIKTFSLWLDDDINFKSFKTEKGWIATKTPEGVLTFTTISSIKLGETVKFGIKTDKEKPIISWEILSKKGKQIEAGNITVSDLPMIIKNNPAENITEIQPKNIIENKSVFGILSDSSFRLIPEKPEIGSPIRVVGENFVANQELDFYIDDKKLNSFQTDDSGFFIFTSKIPDEQKVDRANFIIKDKAGNEKIFSIRLESTISVIELNEYVQLIINESPNTLNRGDDILFSGIGDPTSSITITITDPNGETTTTNVMEVDIDKKWSYNTLVTHDAKFGTYNAIITDSKSFESKSWIIESGKKIQLNPTKLKFDSGEPIMYNGTVIPNEKLEIVVENPKGFEVFANIFEVDSSGYIEFEFNTTLSFIEGTYVLFARQQDETVSVLAGLGELPVARLIVQTNKPHYQAGDVAHLTIDGTPSATVRLIIIDSAERQIYSDSIKLEDDGKQYLDIDLSGYKSGAYTIAIDRGNAKTEIVFTVGLGVGSGPIIVQTTKTDYLPGEQIIILAESGTNILITLLLVDPDGKTIRDKEIFTDNDGKLSEYSFRIPSNAITGTWNIRAESGSNFYSLEINVLPKIEEGMSVAVSEVTAFSNGNGITISGFGAAISQIVMINITSSENEIISPLSIHSTKEGTFSTIWFIPKDIIPGTFTIIATDPFTSAETTIDLP